MKQKIKSNKEQNLYVIPCGKNGFTCLGFDVCLSRSTKLAVEMGLTPKNVKRGTIAAYNEYTRLTNIARKRHAETGWRSESELIPEFIGKEGQRVEIVTSSGNTERYYIGKSTGFIPCHLEIKRNDSTGGSAVWGYPFQSIKFLGVTR
tara:strand:+ start:1170 stop:1613 length:444 start_codon:yes stop_codon:yes gene_type:complete